MRRAADVVQRVVGEERERLPLRVLHGEDGDVGIGRAGGTVEHVGTRAGIHLHLVQLAEGIQRHLAGLEKPAAIEDLLRQRMRRGADGRGPQRGVRLDDRLRDALDEQLAIGHGRRRSLRVLSDGRAVRVRGADEHLVRRNAGAPGRAIAFASSSTSGPAPRLSTTTIASVVVPSSSTSARACSGSCALSAMFALKPPGMFSGNCLRRDVHGRGSGAHRRRGCGRVRPVRQSEQQGHEKSEGEFHWAFPGGINQYARSRQPLRLPVKSAALTSMPFSGCRCLAEAESCQQSGRKADSRPLRGKSPVPVAFQYLPS